MSLLSETFYCGQTNPVSLCIFIYAFVYPFDFTDQCYVINYFGFIRFNIYLCNLKLIINIFQNSQLNINLQGIADVWLVFFSNLQKYDINRITYYILLKKVRSLK